MQKSCSRNRLQLFYFYIMRYNFKFVRAIRSMTNQNHKIDKLIKLNDELENYFRNTIIPQLFVDSDLILRKFTPPAMKQFTLKTGDVGRHIEDIKDNFRFPTIIENIQQVIERNEVLEKEIQTTDLKWFQMNIIPYVVMETNQTNGVIITFVDITARIKDLVHQEMLIADHITLLDTISHDIKGPLTSLLLIVSQLKKESTTKSKSYLTLFGILDRSVRKMQTILTELTESMKLKHKDKIQEELSEEELLDFGNIMEDVRLTLAGTIMHSKAVIKTDIDVSEMLYSRSKLRSIVYNLVNNAIKFQSPDRVPEITVSTKHEGDYILISVKDNGIGIDPSKHKVIFSKYVRVEETVDGSGIGLYLVNEMVSASGGKIVLKSELGKGTEFIVYLMRKYKNQTMLLA
jgi:two-component system phosphate regulon sensor histidine kinase PhoR